MGVSKITVHNLIVGLAIHVHCNSLKHILTEENKVARLLMALHFWNPQDLMKYQDMCDRIHVDEKWSSLLWEREKERYLSFSQRRNPPKQCFKHKSHVSKVMFLCAVAHPRLNPSANSWGDGKLGIWPNGDWELAKHNSMNRAKGTLVWKNKVVIKEVYQDLLISKLLLAIVEKWPRTDRLSRKFLYNKMVQKAIYVRTTRSSMTH